MDNNFKELVLWCIKHKVKSASINGMSFELSDLAFLDALHDLTNSNSQERSDSSYANPGNATLLETDRTAQNMVSERGLDSSLDLGDGSVHRELSREDEELLFWSSGR